MDVIADKKGEDILLLDIRNISILADYFDHTLRSIEETERYLGIPVVGSIGKYPSGILQVS